MQRGIGCGIDRDQEQGMEDVVEQLSERIHIAGLAVDIEESRDLDHPSNVLVRQLVVVEPLSKLRPLIVFTALK